MAKFFRKLILRALLVAIIILPLEFIGWILLHKAYPLMGKFRVSVLNQTSYVAEQRAISQAYLCYIPKPGLQVHGFVQHNSMGFRGDSVPLYKGDSTIRILFMGGSTTYSFEVADPHLAYPEVVGRELLRKDPASGYRVEVINAGLPYGTTAEMLTHYLLKYRYFRPDIAVINTGGNDSESFIREHYQPDYSHWRKNLLEIPEVSPPGRLVFRSYLMSFLIIRMYFMEYLDGNSVTHNPAKTPAWWFPEKSPDQIPLRENAFYQNMCTIIREMKSDSLEILLLSFKGNPVHPEEQIYIPWYNVHEGYLRQMADSFDVHFAPFPSHLIPGGDWVDNCHLNVEGDSIKGRYVAEQVWPILRKVELKKEASDQPDAGGLR